MRHAAVDPWDIFAIAVVTKIRDVDLVSRRIDGAHGGTGAAEYDADKNDNGFHVLSLKYEWLIPFISFACRGSGSEVPGESCRVATKKKCSN